MPINWKNRAKKTEQQLRSREELILSLHKKSANLGFDLVKERAVRIGAFERNLTLAAKLDRATTALNGAVQFIVALDQAAMAATFRMIANDLSPRDTCATGVQEEQRAPETTAWRATKVVRR